MTKAEINLPPCCREKVPTKNWSEFKIAIPVALAFMFLFALLQKIGIVNLVGGGTVTYGTAFVIGIIASLSTCMAVVGGLLLSMSATFAKKGDKLKPQLLFHLGRIVSFFILGGAIGALGSAFQLGTIGTFLMGVIIGLVMLILGLNLLDVFHFSKRLTPAMPKFLSRKALKVAELNHTFTPALVGIATFFLPCGFTQSMQIYSLTTGSFWGGALTMLFFALGTLPVLALISFGAFSIKNSSRSGIFFKAAGLIVILFALFNLLSSLVAVGLVPSFPTGEVISTDNVRIIDGQQIIEVEAKGGYWPRKSVAQSGLPTILRFKTNGTFDCSSSLRIPSLRLSKMLAPSGVTEIDLGLPAAGTVSGTCGMGMYSFAVEFEK